MKSIIMPFEVPGPELRHPLRTTSAPWGTPIKAITAGQVLVSRVDELGVVRLFLHPIVSDGG